MNKPRLSAFESLSPAKTQSKAPFVPAEGMDGSETQLILKATAGLTQLYHRVSDVTTSESDFQKQTLLQQRYSVVSVIGRGTFAQIVQAIDTFSSSKRNVAIKVMNPEHNAIGIRECTLLQELNQNDPSNGSHIVRLLSSFYEGKHFCLVLELLETSLYQHLRSLPPLSSPADKQRNGVSIKEFRKMAVQLLSALLHMKNNRIIHADLKPENVVLSNKQFLNPELEDKRTHRDNNEDPNAGLACMQDDGVLAWEADNESSSTRAEGGVIVWDVGQKHRETKDLQWFSGLTLKICDLSNSMKTEDACVYYEEYQVQTLQYRAPEVILGIPFGEEIDMWSLGCIFIEVLNYGSPLFKVSATPAEILKQMWHLLGPLPKHPFATGRFYPQYFTSSHQLRDTPAHVRHILPTHSRLLGIGRLVGTKNTELMDLLLQMLEYDPAKRLTPREAICHPFFAPLFPFASLCGISTQKSSGAQAPTEQQSTATTISYSRGTKRPISSAKEVHIVTSQERKQTKKDAWPLLTPKREFDDSVVFLS